MKLLTKELLNEFAKVGSQEQIPTDDQIVVAKFFLPVGRATWYATEYDPKNEIFFGYVSIFGDWNDEWGSFSLQELQEVRCPAPFSMLGVERDMSWKPTKFSDIKEVNK